MEPEGAVPAQRLSRIEWAWALVLAAVLFIFVALSVPLSILIPKEISKSPAASVILPLYVYPHDNSTWEAVYEV